MARSIQHNFQSLLSSPDRDYLIRNNGDQVKIESLKRKNLGLYFSAAWCGPCQRFTSSLVEVYTELSCKDDFEIIFLSADDDEESFKQYFSKMPWLAVPFSDSVTIDRLDDLFKVRGIPHLIILDERGKVSTDSGVDIVEQYGAEGYPFTPDKMAHLVKQEEVAISNQSLRSILASPSREFVISSNGEKVPVSELEGKKVVGLYFSMFSFGPCLDFLPKLVDVYEKLKANGERFEIVLIPLDEDKELFEKCFRNIPWFALPFKDMRCKKLVRYFEPITLPSLVIIGDDGKTLHPNAADAIEGHGVQAYPFTPEKFKELEESQTLQSVLVLGDHDFVIGKDGAKVSVSTLVGKTILLYFSANWSPGSRALLPKLIEAYHKINEKGDALEVIFISRDTDESSFDQVFSRIPWLALPFRDPRITPVSRKFKVQDIPMIVAIGPDGRTVMNNATELIEDHGGEAYPFTAARVKQLELQIEEMAKKWPEKIKHTLHDDHELILSHRNNYICDGCQRSGRNLSYLCGECDFDLHPMCALGNQEHENKK